MPAVVKLSSLVYICWMIRECHTDVTMVKPRELLLPNWKGISTGSVGWRIFWMTMSKELQYCSVSEGRVRSDVLKILMGTILLTIPINGSASKIQCTFSNFGDDMKRHSWHTVGKRWHPEKPDGLEEWAQGNFMNSSKAKYKVLHLGQNNA